MPVCFGPASPDAGVELLRQLFLQCKVSFIYAVSLKQESVILKIPEIYAPPHEIMSLILIKPPFIFLSDFLISSSSSLYYLSTI